MNLSSLRAIAPGLEVIQGNDLVFFEDLSSFEEVKDNSLTFLASAKTCLKFNRFGNLKDFSRCGIIVDQSIWGKVNAEIEKNNWGVITLVPKVEELVPKLSEFFFQRHQKNFNDLVDGRQMGTVELHPTSWVGQNVFLGSQVKIGANVTIHPGSVVMSECEVGEGSVIYPNVTLYPRVKIGKNCRIHSATVIGADGFGYNFFNGSHNKIWHFGGVHIEDFVEIGACSAVDGGTFSPTRIGQGSKLDNHVQVGHNCRLGKGVILCGHVAIGGSSIIGDFSVFGGKSGMGHGLEVGQQVQVAGGALVNCDWPAKSVLGGHPARPLKEWMKGLAYVRKVSLELKKGD